MGGYRHQNKHLLCLNSVQHTRRLYEHLSHCFPFYHITFIKQVHTLYLLLQVRILYLHLKCCTHFMGVLLENNNFIVFKKHSVNL